MAHRLIIQYNNMRLPFIRAQLKLLSVAAGLESVAFDNVFTGGKLADLGVIKMITDDEFASCYHARSPYNFQHFNVSRVEMIKNWMTYPPGGYTSNKAEKYYIINYIKFHEQLGNDTGDKCVYLTPVE